MRILGPIKSVDGTRRTNDELEIELDEENIIKCVKSQENKMSVYGDWIVE